METLHEFRLGFTTAQNGVGKITVPRANPDALPGQIGAAMQAMIDSNVLQWNVGEAMFRHSANLVAIERRPIDVWTN
jgi:hypothetical protein